MECWSQQWVLKAVIIAAIHDDRYNCIHLNIFRTSDYLTSLSCQYYLVKNGTDSHSRKNHSCIYTGFPVEKNKSLPSLHVFFPHLYWWKPLTPCIFAYSFSPVHHKSLRGCCSLPRLPLHSREKYMFVLNKCFINSYSTALVGIHSYSSPAPSKTVILFREKSWCITTGMKCLPFIS